MTALFTTSGVTWDSLRQIPLWQARHHVQCIYRKQLQLPKDLALLQTNPGKYCSVATGFRITHSKGGLKGLMWGWPSNGHEGRRRTAPELLSIPRRSSAPWERNAPKLLWRPAHKHQMPSMPGRAFA